MGQPKTTSSEIIPEVERFLTAQQRLENLKEAYPEVFGKLHEIAEEYNTSLEAADKALRARELSCGPFILYQKQTKYDAEKLYEELGKDRFLEVGGTMKTVTVYEVDRARLEARIAAGAVPQAVLEDVRTVTPRYKKPDKIAI